MSGTAYVPDGGLWIDVQTVSKTAYPVRFVTMAEWLDIHGW